MSETVHTMTSHALARVVLTGPDAQKFQKEVRYGRASEGAKESVKRGVMLAKRFREQGQLELKVKSV
jgi:hypothetical protein